MKRLTLILILLALATFVGAGNALAYMIDDNTKVLPRRSNDGGYGTTWTDVIGSPAQFDIHGIDVSFSGNNIIFDMYTNFNHDGKYKLGTYEVYTYLADLALDLDQDGSFEYGVVLLDHDQWTKGNLTYPTNLADMDVALYSVSNWHTSFDFMNGYTNPMVYYGGKWDENNPQKPYLAIKSGTKLVDATVGVTGLSGEPYHKWTATFDYTLSSGFADGLTDGFDVFWSGMTCSNDAIVGSVSSSTPEPATLVLTVFGLIGLVAFGRNKVKKN